MVQDRELKRLRKEVERAKEKAEKEEEKLKLEAEKKRLKRQLFFTKRPGLAKAVKVLKSTAVGARKQIAKQARLIAEQQERERKVAAKSLKKKKATLSPIGKKATRGPGTIILQIGTNGKTIKTKKKTIKKKTIKAKKKTIKAKKKMTKTKTRTKMRKKRARIIGMREESDFFSGLPITLG